MTRRGNTTSGRPASATCAPRMMLSLPAPLAPTLRIRRRPSGIASQRARPGTELVQARRASPAYLGEIIIAAEAHRGLGVRLRQECRGLRRVERTALHRQADLRAARQ